MSFKSGYDGGCSRVAKLCLEITSSGRAQTAAQGLRAALMAATMLAGAAALAAVLPQQALAQNQIIDDEDVTVPGDQPDPWIIGGGLFVGNFGNGTLTIENGSRVENTVGVIGNSPVSSGSVSVTGAGAQWINSLALAIGGSGEGTLTIEHGGRVENASGLIASDVGSVGAVTVTGAGSEWINSGGLAVGQFGTGTLTIANGGVVSATSVTLNVWAAGTGTLNFGAAAGDAAVAAGTLDTPTIAFGDGTGTIVFNHTDDDFELDADISGNGTVRILSGRTILSGNNTYTGNTLLEGGTLTLGHSNALGGSTLTTTGSVVDYADGVDIANSIVIDSDTTQFQVLTGSATQSGVISEDNGPRPFEKVGDGELILTAANTWTGQTRVRSGTLVVDGGSITHNSSQLRVGLENGDNGTLVIAGGGTVSSLSSAIGQLAGSTGEITVTGAGSALINPGNITVGNSGVGTLNIEHGATVSNNVGFVGNSSGAGHVNVVGAGSTWTNSSHLFVGRHDGTLTISGGGTVSSSIGYIAYHPDSTGAVTITGEGSSWTSTVMQVGVRGDAALTISNGGILESQGGVIALNAGSTGTATVTGQGSSWTTIQMNVGNRGAGVLIVSDGGVVTNLAGGILGALSGSTGTATVTGAGARFTNADVLTVGHSGTGTLTIADDGEVSADEVIIANNASSTGTVYIGSDGVAPSGAGILNTPSVTFGAGTGALVFNHTNCCGLFFDADISSDPLGQAFILHAEGLTHLTGNSAGFAGGALVGGGALSVDGTLGSGGVELGVDGPGILTGSGTIGGDVLVTGGGTLLGVSGSTLTITGDLELDAGSFVIAGLGAPGDGELFAVGGDLTLDGMLDVIDIGGFGAGVYGVFTYGGALTDNGFTLGSAPVADPLPGELTIQTSVAGQVNLVSNIGVDLLFWDGGDPANALNGVIDGGDGVWSANSFTFTDADGLVSGPSRPTPGFIVFSGAAGNVTVDDSEGGIEIAGAQFAVDGYVIDGDAITLAGNGDGDAIFRVGNGTAAGAGFGAIIGSDLSGDAALVLTDLGTLILTGTNSYTGGTEVRSGTLIGSTSSIIGDIANDGVVVFDQADDAALDQALSGDGLFRFTGGAEFKLGSGNSYAGGTQVFGSQLVLTADDSAGTGAITLNNSNIAYDDGIIVSNTLTFSGTNELQVRSGTATHAGQVTGGGDLGLTGAGTLIFAGNGSAFTGNTVITGNVLMNGVLGGTIEVAEGGVLRGFGTLGSTRMLSGSTIAPGNSVGTLTIDGDLSFEDGSVYEVTVLANGLTDLIAVTGAVTIDPGALITTDTLAGFTFGVRNTILSASGGITGTFEFDEAISNLPFVSSGLETSGNDVVLFFGRNDTPFETLTSGRNAASVAQAADALGAGNPLWQVLVWLDTASAPLAFEALNGEIHATHRQLVLDESIHTRRAVTSRLAAARSEEAGSAWISGHFGGAQLGSREGVSRVSADTSGVMLGLDAPLHEAARIGVMAAFGETGFNLTGQNGSGMSESRSLGVYGGSQWGALGVSAGAIYGWHDLSTNRLVSFPGINEHISSSHSADSLQLFGEASLAGPAGFEPFLTLAHVRLDTGSFSEAGGVSTLALDGETRQMTQGTLGSRFAHDWQAGEAYLRFEGSLGWRRVFSGHRQYVSGDLAGAPVYFEGNGVDRDAAAIEAGVTIEPAGRMSLELGYAGEIGSNARNHGAEFRARWAF